MGVRVEAGLGRRRTPRALSRSTIDGACLRVLIEINEQNLADALKALEGVIAILDCGAARAAAPAAWL